jgi:hypothetical protein
MMIVRRFAAVVSKPLISFNAAVRCGGPAAVAAVPCNPLTSFNAAVCGGCVALTPVPPTRAPRALHGAPRAHGRRSRFGPSTGLAATFLVYADDNRGPGA